MKAHCLLAVKIVHHLANGRFDWLISGHQRVNPLREAISMLSGKYKRLTFVHPESQLWIISYRLTCMNWFDVRVAFSSGLVRSYLDFLLILSCVYPLRVLISFKIIALQRQAEGVVFKTMKTRYISHVLMFKLKCVSRDRSMSGNLLNFLF